MTSPHFSLFDAVYMTAITLSTVGYSEMDGFTDLGRFFALFFILVAFLIVALAIRYIIEGLLYQWSPHFIQSKKN